MPSKQRQPTALTRALLRRRPLPPPRAGDGKEERGTIMVIGGAKSTPGAVVLAAMAALRAGAGRLQIATAKSVAPFLGVSVPEALVVSLPETRDGAIHRRAAGEVADRAARADALVIGPGMVDHSATAAFLTALFQRLASGPVIVLDAGAVSTLNGNGSMLARYGGDVVLTPHAGEMAALLDEDINSVLANAVDSARRASAAYNAVTLLKGPSTIIARPDGRTWRYDGGDVGLATSGSGDVLAGVIAGLAARGADSTTAALWGVFLHGEAGNVLAERNGRIGFLARELAPEIPKLLEGEGRGDSSSKRAVRRRA